MPKLSLFYIYLSVSIKLFAHQIENIQLNDVN